jgi:hypothetical protein
MTKAYCALVVVWENSIAEIEVFFMAATRCTKPDNPKCPNDLRVF